MMRPVKPGLDADQGLDNRNRLINHPRKIFVHCANLTNVGSWTSLDADARKQQGAMSAASLGRQRRGKSLKAQRVDAGPWGRTWIGYFPQGRLRILSSAMG
jgi:hypothetical protein